MDERKSEPCPFCGEMLTEKNRPARVRDGWGHTWCRIAARNQDRVNSGETFRKQTPSEWRQKFEEDPRGRMR